MHDSNARHGFNASLSNCPCFYWQVGVISLLLLGFLQYNLAKVGQLIVKRINYEYHQTGILISRLQQDEKHSSMFKCITIDRNNEFRIQWHY